MIILHYFERNIRGRTMFDGSLFFETEHLKKETYHLCNYKGAFIKGDIRNFKIDTGETEKMSDSYDVTVTPEKSYLFGWIKKPEITKVKTQSYTIKILKDVKARSIIFELGGKQEIMWEIIDDNP